MKEICTSLARDVQSGSSQLFSDHVYCSPLGLQGSTQWRNELPEETYIAIWWYLCIFLRLPGRPAWSIRVCSPCPRTTEEECAAVQAPCSPLNRRPRPCGRGAVFGVIQYPCSGLGPIIVAQVILWMNLIASLGKWVDMPLTFRFTDCLPLYKPLLRVPWTDQDGFKRDHILHQVQSFNENNQTYDRLIWSQYSIIVY
jgi:hypothetical protein